MSLETYLGQKFTLVDVQIGATDSTCLHLELCSRYQHALFADQVHSTYKDIVITEFGERDFDDAKLFWLLISCEARWSAV